MTANNNEPDTGRRLRAVEDALYNLQRERQLLGSPLDNVPTGTIAGFLTQNPPQGWILVAGQVITAAAYPALYAYLVANSLSTTLPDYADKFLVGAGNTYTSTSTGGSANSVVVTHTHPIDANTTLAENPGQGTTTSANFQDRVLVSGTGTDISTASTGSSGTNANLPPYRGVYWMIRT